MGGRWSAVVSVCLHLQRSDQIGELLIAGDVDGGSDGKNQNTQAPPLTVWACRAVHADWCICSCSHSENQK